MAETVTAKIAADDNARCTFKTEKGRRCLLEIHPDSVKHKMVDRSKTEHHALSAVLPAGFSFKAETVGATEKLKKESNRKDTAPRDQDQKRIDREAKQNHEKNVAANKHAGQKFEEFTLSRYIVPPKAVDTVLEYLRRAAGTGGTVHGAVFRYRKGTHASGNVQLQWAFVKPDPNPKSKANTNTSES